MSINVALNFVVKGTPTVVHALRSMQGVPRVGELVVTGGQMTGEVTEVLWTLAGHPEVTVVVDTHPGEEPKRF